MRVLLVFTVINAALAADVAMNLPCNKEMDGLLAQDPEGDPSAFLSCQSIGIGNIGFWERKMCPNDMVFDFINQQCKTQSKKARKQPILNIAILNNSCARGETCIGGTVCDLKSMRCLCPYGTVPNLETLSCESKDPSYTQPQTFNFNSFGNVEKAPSSFSSNPAQTESMFKPNPNYSKFTSGNGFVNNNNNNFNGNGNTQPNFNFNTNNKNGNGFLVENIPWKPAAVNTNNNFNVNNNNNNNNNNFGFQPNQKFVFTTTPPQTTKKIPVLAGPGQSCRANEICRGGSICTLPIGLCLCPGELEARDGECVLPASASIKIQKVGIGALCSDLAECDNGSSCVLGRCACVSPLVQHEGKCVLRQERKEVGPGEPCDNGEICIRGSVCDSVIPVCLCPPETDLAGGQCVRVATQPTRPPPTQSPRPMTYAPPAPKTQAPPTYVPPTYAPQPPKPQPQATYRPRQPNPVYTTKTPSQPVQQPATHNYMTAATAAPFRPTAKPNHMKISLGGSKQAGVGVRCSLNTDCMIGAYCNGNTSPPSCQCLSTHVNIAGRCEKVVYPGQIGCKSDMQCSAAYTGTSCIDRFCVCPEGAKAVDQTCVPANEPVTSPPGGSCTEARECTGGSVCREGWCICPDASMIVQRGICIQSGPRPTLPPRQTVPIYTTAPVYQTAKPIYQTAVSTPNFVTQTAPVNTFNALPTANHQGRKVTPGNQCGPLDTCVGSSMCVDGMCLCPAGTQPTQQGRCEATTSSYVTNAPSRTTTVKYVRPGEDCSDGEVCTGGSECNDDWDCECPSDKPMIKDNQCQAVEMKKAGPGESCNEHTECINNSTCHSGQCRCAPQFVAVSGHCVAVPMPTTPQMKTVKFAKPLESCDDGEQCEGGASCDEDTGICMCPAGQIVFGIQCQAPPPPRVQTTKQAIQTTQTLPTTTTSARPTTECANDSNCGDRKKCVAGKCRCRPGTVDNAGVCEPLEEMEVGERPVPISYARHRVLSERVQAEPSSEDTTDYSQELETTTKMVRTPSRQETKRPRIVGPPIRRPTPKPKTKSNRGGGSGGGSGSYKTGGSGNGNCPPGNDATKDSSGNLILCNGLEPNCPPRSYCYITSGGFATEEYNCCKSW